MAFGKLAEICAQHLRKGREVYVEGRLRLREYEAKKDGGGKRQRTEIIAERVQFLRAPGDAKGAEVSSGEAAGDDYSYC